MFRPDFQGDRVCVLNQVVEWQCSSSLLGYSVYSLLETQPNPIR